MQIALVRSRPVLVWSLAGGAVVLAGAALRQRNASSTFQRVSMGCVKNNAKNAILTTLPVSGPEFQAVCQLPKQENRSIIRATEAKMPVNKNGGSSPGIIEFQP